jgi:hypothetical protein
MSSNIKINQSQTNHKVKDVSKRSATGGTGNLIDGTV